MILRAEVSRPGRGVHRAEPRGGRPEHARKALPGRFDGPEAEDAADCPADQSVVDADGDGRWTRRKPGSMRMLRRRSGWTAGHGG